MSLITKPTINKIDVEIRFSKENCGGRVFPAFSNHFKKLTKMKKFERNLTKMKKFEKNYNF